MDCLTKRNEVLCSRTKKKLLLKSQIVIETREALDRMIVTTVEKGEQINKTINTEIEKIYAL